MKYLFYVEQNASKTIFIWVLVDISAETYFSNYNACVGGRRGGGEGIDPYQRAGLKEEKIEYLKWNRWERKKKKKGRTQRKKRKKKNRKKMRKKKTKNIQLRIKLWLSLKHYEPIYYRQLRQCIFVTGATDTTTYSTRVELWTNILGCKWMSYMVGSIICTTWTVLGTILMTLNLKYQRRYWKTQY